LAEGLRYSELSVTALQRSKLSPFDVVDMRQQAVANAIEDALGAPDVNSLEAEDEDM
jgi:hypothetical protein